MASTKGLVAFFKGRQGVMTAAIVAIPLLYFLGFLAWAFFAVYYGLGFLPLTVTQLMAAGTAILVLVSLPLLADTLLFKLLDRLKDKPATPKNRRGRFWLHMLSRFSAFVLAFAVVAGFLGLIPFLRMKPLELTLYFLFAGLMAALLHLYGWYSARKSGSLNPNRKKLGKTAVEVRIFSRLSAALVMYVVFIVALFPAMRPEYHGPEPRIATLDIERAGFSADTLARLWPEWNPGPGAVVRTPEVRVLFLGNDVILLRSVCEGERSGALVTLDRSAVPGIIWQVEEDEEYDVCQP